MKGTNRLRRLSPYILTAALAIIVGACSGAHPNTTFDPHSDLGRDSADKPPQTHGSTKLEILWTLIPAVILVFIAIPTVRTIFKTQAKAPAGSLEVEVIGHQWWWEFKYPEYGITTANEVYVPVGRTVNFTLHSADVIHSFWAPQLGGKRDVVTNHTNFLWYTPDSSLETSVWNGFCAEYCGTSHANMRFRVFTVKPDEFAKWVAWQKSS